MTPTPEQVAAAREWWRDTDTTQPEGWKDLAALLAERESAAYLRGFEEAKEQAKKIADELGEVETHVSGSVPMTGNLVQEASKMAARLTRKGIAAAIRALRPKEKP